MRDETYGFSPLTVVITDGKSTNENLTIYYAWELKQISTIMAVGVGDEIEISELNTIASESRYVYNIADFDELLASSKEMLGQIF